MAQTASPPNNTDWWERVITRWHRFINSGFMQAMRTLLDFFLNGHFIMATGKWVALVGARTAVTVLFFASLWVAGESTVHPFMVQIVSHLPFVNTDTLDNLALTAFTWLPEIIVLEAILKTVFFTIDVIKNEKRVWSSIWGAIYLPLTGVFVYIAVSTFMSYITTHAADQSNTGMLLFRALMAWIYSVIEMAYPAIYHKMYHEAAPAQVAVLAPVPAPPPIDVQQIVTQAINGLQTRFDQRLAEIAAEQRKAQECLLTTVQEVKETQQTLQIAAPVASQDELVNMVVARLHTLFAEQQAAKKTRQLSASPNGRVDAVADEATHTPHPQQTLQPARPEIGKRPRRIDPAEVDAVVHPLLNRDRSLTHRKIAAMPGIPYTETVVYASVKRWREKQPVVEGDLLDAESQDESGVS